jgi:hypothetical protein
MDAVISSLLTLEDPLVFSQSHALSTSEVSSEAKKRAVDLDAATLRELYHRGDLAPIAEITTRKVRAAAQVPDLPSVRGGLQAKLRRALSDGRLRDPGAEPFRPRMRFDSRRLTDPAGWMNGLIYSRWQLLAIPDLERAAHTPQGPRSL